MFPIIASCISVSQSVSLFVYSWSTVWPFCEATVLNSTSPCFPFLISHKENTYGSRHPYIVLISFNLVFDLYYTPCFKPWWIRSNMATLCFKNSFQNARTHTHTPSSSTDRIVAVNACRVTDSAGFKAQGPRTWCIVFIRTHSAHYKTHHLLYYLYARNSFFFLRVCKWPTMMKGEKRPVWRQWRRCEREPCPWCWNMLHISGWDRSFGK